MNLTECKVSSGWICFKCGSIQEAYKVQYGFKPGNYDLTVHKNKRSINANSYAWELIGQIARKLGIDPVEVYRNEIRDVSPKFREVYISSDCIEEERKHWTANHLGRDLVVQWENDGWCYCYEYYGSSDFTTAEMSRLINNLVQDCTEMEIETKDPGWIKSLLESWNGRKT